MNVSGESLRQNPGYDPPSKNFMLTFTPAAIEKAKAILAKTGKEGAAIRLGVKGGGCSGFSYEMVRVHPAAGVVCDTEEGEISPDWDRMEFDGLTVYMDQMSAMYLEGTEVDYVEQMDGSGFKFNNPNVKTTCGCGSSFTV